MLHPSTPIRALRLHPCSPSRYTSQSMNSVSGARFRGIQTILLSWAIACLAWPATATRAQDSLPELVRRIKPSAVAIETFDSHGEKLSRGSGFFVDMDRVVTNRHVI